MNKIDTELLSKLEKLSRLRLSDDEKVKIEKDLTSIVEMFDRLQEVNTEGVKPRRHMTEAINVLRSDEVNHELTNEEALKNAPQTENGFIAVPKFLKPKK